MRVLAFTDIHESLAALHILRKKSQLADFLVCSGDISVFQHRMRSVLRKLNSFGKPVFIIHGNHEDELEFAACCSGLANIHFVHRRAVPYGGFTIVGYGGGGFSESDSGLDSFGRKLARERHQNIIFLSHAPPFGSNLDYIGDGHYGSKSVRDFIYLLKPKLTVCGHFHENFNRKDIIKGCFSINPGPKGRVLLKL